MTGTELALLEHGELAEIDRREIERVAAEVDQVVAVVEQVEVTDEQSASDATEAISRLRQVRNANEAARKQRVKPHNDFVKKINASYKEALGGLDVAEKTVRGKLQAFLDEQERLRREEEARIRAEQAERQRREEEARRLKEAEAEAYRMDAEREARLAAEAARARDDEAAQQAVDEARERVAAERAAEQAIKSMPQHEAPQAVVPQAAPIQAASGTASTSQVWDFEVQDDTRVPLQYRPVDERLIRQHMRDSIRETKQPPEIPGVRFFTRRQLGVRSR